MVLQGTRNDFRRAGGTAVDQHDDWLATGQIAWCGVVALNVVLVPAARRNDFTAIEEGVGDANGLAEQSAWIESQIQHIALQLVV